MMLKPRNPIKAAIFYIPGTYEEELAAIAKDKNQKT